MKSGIATFFVCLCLSGCGAETAVVASIGYIAPIGGDFNEDTDTTTPQLESSGKVINIQIGDGWDQFYDTRFDVTGTTDLDGLIDSCSSFTGIVDQRHIDAFSSGSNSICFSGDFENESTLVLDDGRRLLRNFPIDLASGSWENIDNSKQLFKFDAVAGNSFTGCEIADNSITPVTGVFTASDINNGVLASIPQFTIQRSTGSEQYTGEFRGASGIILSSADKQIKLQRKDRISSCQ
jgi:hypothetical protein